MKPLPVRVQHVQIARWLAGGAFCSGTRRCKIRCVIQSSVVPYAASIVDSVVEGEGVFWEVRATVDGFGTWGKARTIDEAFALSLEWLARAVK